MKEKQVDLDRAKILRQAEIVMLRTCTCAYPVKKYRNHTGHNDECPAHILHTTLREELKNGDDPG